MQVSDALDRLRWTIERDPLPQGVASLQFWVQPANAATDVLNL
jgi:hypothetical protein